MEEVSVLGHGSAELVVDQLDLDGLLGRRHERRLRRPRPETGDEALRLGLAGKQDEATLWNINSTFRAEEVRKGKWRVGVGGGGDLHKAR